MHQATTVTGRSFIKKINTFLSADGQKQLKLMVALSIFGGICRGGALVAFLPAATTLVSGETAWGLGLGGWLLILGGLALISAVTEYFLAMSNYRVALDSVQNLHQQIGDQVSQLPLGYFKPETAGELSRLVSKQMLTLGESFAHMVSPMIMHACTMLVLLVGCWFWAPIMGALLTATVPIVALGAYLARKCEAHSNRKSEPSSLEVSSRLVEFAQNQTILRACGKAENYPPLTDAVKASEKASAKGMWWSLLGQLINGSVTQAVAVLAMVLAVSVGSGFRDPIATIVFIGIMLRFTTMLSEIGQLAMGLENSQPLLNQVDNLLTAPVIEAPTAPEPPKNPGAIEMRNVGFAYEPGRPVLRNVSFSLQPHSYTAIVGPSGSGKTTIARLIARFYPASSGSILVGGTPVEKQELAVLMQQLAWVFQDVYLYDDTLRANILVGKQDASAEELAFAAQLAGVNEIVERLPQGWDTPVGEGGRALSGGERQRISIARAILKKAPIVLFDEATSALDPANERHVMQALQYLKQNATVIVIAHKLSTIVEADQILVLNDHGEICQRGTHQELIAQAGTYREFCRLREQAQGWSLL